jgi:5-methylcytosine-specific restriction protein A
VRSLTDSSPCGASMAKVDWHHLYDSARWKRMRVHQLSCEPLCRMCKQRDVIRGACVADHVVPHKGSEQLFFNDRNLQSLCRDCHTITKARQEHRGYLQGCDSQGSPLDPQHRWHGNEQKPQPNRKILTLNRDRGSKCLGQTGQRPTPLISSHKS